MLRGDAEAGGQLRHRTDPEILRIDQGECGPETIVTAPDTRFPEGFRTESQDSPQVIGAESLVDTGFFTGAVEDQVNEGSNLIGMTRQDASTRLEERGCE